MRLTDDRPIKIVAFGTSLTASGGWTDALRKAVEECIGHSAQVVTIALSGATSSWGVKTVDLVVLESPDIVLIELYANDAALHRFVSIRRSRSNLTKIVEYLQKHSPDLRIIFLAMNPFHGLRRFIRPRLRSYIEAHNRVALEKQIEFIDLRPLWFRLPKETLAEAIPDGGHPLPEWNVKIMVPALAARVAGNRCPKVNHGATLYPEKHIVWEPEP